MKQVNDIRSKVTSSLLEMLDDLETGTGGDFGGGHPDDPEDGFACFGMCDYHKLKGQLNSYRAQKIAQLLGKTINKQRLLKYAKPKDYEYSLTNAELEAWLQANEQSLRDYWKFNKGVMTQDRG